MKNRATVICVCLIVLGMAPAMFADVTDYIFNVNGTSYCPAFTTVAACSNLGGLAAVSGLSSSLDTSSGGTGLGSITFTYNPGPGKYLVDFWLFEQLSQPGFNEYGNTGGTAASGQSWQIDVPDYDYNSTDPNFGSLPAGAGSIVANTLAGTLGNTNYLTGDNSQYLLSCSGDPTCNDYASMAMGFNFSLAANFQEVITFDVTTTKPTSGFYLEQIHPVDGNNTTEVDYYLTGTATAEKVGGGGTPEPGTGILVTAFVAALLSPLGRRLRNRVR